MALDTEVVRGRRLELERPWPSMARRGPASRARTTLAESSGRDPAGGSQAQAGPPFPRAWPAAPSFMSRCILRVGFPIPRYPRLTGCLAPPSSRDVWQVMPASVSLGLLSEQVAGDGGGEPGNKAPYKEDQV